VAYFAYGAIRHITGLVHVAGELIQLSAKLDYKVIRHAENPCNFLATVVRFLP
jgi:hypothetical protein